MCVAAHPVPQLWVLREVPPRPADAGTPTQAPDAHVAKDLSRGRERERERERE